MPKRIRNVRHGDQFRSRTEQPLVFIPNEFTAIVDRHDAKLRARFSHASCQGTIFEWCSISVMRISSPSSSPRATVDCATRLMPSVVAPHKDDFLGWDAPINRATFLRAASLASVRFFGQRVSATVNIRVNRRVVIRNCVDDLPRLLRRRGAVEIDEPLPP